MHPRLADYVSRLRLRLGHIRLFSKGCANAASEQPSRWLTPTGFVHVGNVIMLAGLCQTDMLQLRFMLVGASTCGIAYNLLQPTPLIAPAVWGLAFLSTHFYQIRKLMRERRARELDADTEQVFTLAFNPYGFTRQQVEDIMQQIGFRWCTWSYGEMVRRKGEEMDELHFVYEGSVLTLSTTDDPLHKLDGTKGGWLGEFFDPNQEADYWERDHPSPVSYKCKSKQCRTLALPRRAMHEALSAEPRLKELATRATVKDVWSKLHRTIREMRTDAYRNMLEVALIDGVLDSTERVMLEEFKKRHKVSDEDHKEVLDVLGWSEDEFKAGRKAKRQT